MIQRCISLWLLFVLLFAAPSVSAIETQAAHAYMIDATTGAVLLNKEGEVAMIPSSMSKLMTAYLVFDRLKSGRLHLDDALTVSEKAWRMQGSKTFVKVGDQVRVDDLIHGVIVQSGNDACIVLAEGVSGSEPAFVEEMNAMAAKLGLKQSHFVNATGWPDQGHVMSARDLALLAKHIIQDFPEYYPIYSTKEYRFNNILQMNRNRLLGNDIGVDGLKTGHTDAAGYGITLSAKQGERRLILVINGLPSDDARVKEGDMLLRWGFREFENRSLLPAGKEIARAAVWFGTQQTIPLVAEKELLVTLPKGQQQAMTARIHYLSPIPAPIAKGAHIADLSVEIAGGEKQILPLVAGEAVSKTTGLGHVMAVLRHYAPW